MSWLYRHERFKLRELEKRASCENGLRESWRTICGDDAGLWLAASASANLSRKLVGGAVPCWK